jgi:CRP/FNR family cyclic AMP-dependent transcriptional regulator
MRPTMESYADGDLVFRQGQLGDRMFIVTTGGVRIYREDRGVDTTLANVGPGETFGELALFDHHPRSASARAIGDTQLRVVTREEFMDLDCDEIIRQMLATLARRLRSTDEAFERLSSKEAPERERLAEFIRTRDWAG